MASQVRTLQGQFQLVSSSSFLRSEQAACSFLVMQVPPLWHSSHTSGSGYIQYCVHLSFLGSVGSTFLLQSEASGMAAILAAEVW